MSTQDMDAIKQRYGVPAGAIDSCLYSINCGYVKEGPNVCSNCPQNVQRPSVQNSRMLLGSDRQPGMPMGSPVEWNPIDPHRLIQCVLAESRMVFSLRAFAMASLTAFALTE